jgi:hypothetical protein
VEGWVDGDDLAGGGGVNGLADRILEQVVGADDLIRREGAHDGVRVPLMQDGGGEADGRAGILRLAFEHEVGVLHLGKLAADGGPVGGTGHHEDALAGERLEAVIGGAQQRAA